ncbi:MAG: cyclic nucleotide-binding domain-containing protein [Myxococcales bacterium]|nr:cyclic nucleotide-binding domain-containing protein [Myxococcales bacterium]
MSDDERKRLRQSLSGYKRLLAIEPDNVGHLEQLARISLALGQAGRAAGFLVKRAEVLARRGEVDVALADCRQALAIVPGQDEAMKLLPVLERLNRAAPALIATPNPSEMLAIRSPRPELSLEERSRATLPLDPIRLEEELALDAVGLDEPVVDASALLAVHDVDGIDVVALPSDAPEPAVTWLRPEAPADVTQRPVQAVPSLPAVMPPVPAEGFGDPEDSLEVELEQVEAVLRLATGGPEAAPTSRFVAPLPETALFGALPRATRADLARLADWRRYKAGAVLGLPGEPCAELLIVVEGQLAVRRPEGEGGDVLTRLGAGEVVGDLERVHGGPWRLHVSAETPVQVVALEAIIVDGLRRRFPAFDLLLRRSSARRHGSWLLGANPMFKGLGPAERAFIAEHLEPRRLGRAGVLCEEGAPLDVVALVAGGTLEVTREGRPIATLRPGRLAGLGALGHEGHATARIVAGEKGALLYVLDRGAVEAIRRLPAVREVLDAAIAQRA